MLISQGVESRGVELLIISRGVGILFSTYII